MPIIRYASACCALALAAWPAHGAPAHAADTAPYPQSVQSLQSAQSPSMDGWAPVAKTGPGQSMDGWVPVAKKGPGLSIDGWVPVDANALDQARGGFTLETGLRLSLGIEREVSINGNVVSRTSLQLADISRLSSEQAQQTSEALSAVKLVQNGRDNIYVAAMSPQTLGGTVVQNSLNDQLIRTHTVIHSSVNSMALLKTLNFHGSLGDAIARAAGPH